MGVPPPVPARHHAAVLVADRTVECRELPVPTIGEHDVLVRVDATGVCGSDLSTWRGLHPYKKAPVVLGHELCGTVIAQGDGVTGIAVGERVVSAAYSPCDQCAACRRGATNRCTARTNLSHGGWNGSFAEYVRLRDNMIFAVDPAVDVEAAALAEPLSIALHAVRLADPAPGHRIAILGAGGIGLCCALVLHRLDRGPVVCVDRGPEKFSLVTRTGARSYVDATVSDVVPAVLDLTGGGADVTIVASGYPGVLDHAGAVTSSGGAIVVVSYFDGPQTVALNPFVARELTVRFSALSTARDFADIVGWLDTGVLDPRPLVTHRFPVADADAALRTLDSGAGGIGKIMLRPG